VGRGRRWSLTAAQPRASPAMREGTTRGAGGKSQNVLRPVMRFAKLTSI
jgi:hypothetical protein